MKIESKMESNSYFSPEEKQENVEINDNVSLGTPSPSKTDEFSEKFQKGGGGSFSIQKFILQNLDL